MARLIDTSVFCGHWPFRNLSSRDPDGLREHLRRRGVDCAWVASAEAVFYPDPMEANEPLFNAIGGDPFFVPFAIIDVTLPQYLADAQACVSRWNCGGFKLLPNYHRFSLNDPRVHALLKLSAGANVPVCIQMRMIDERSHHPLMLVPGVAAADIAELARHFPGNRLLACGAYGSELAALSSAPNVWAEISFVESGDTLVEALKKIPESRLCFGSHSPFHYFEAEAAKLHAAGDVAAETMQKIMDTNATQLRTGG